MTQGQVEERAGITPRSLTKYERPRRSYSFESLEKILGALDASLLDLHYAIEGTSPPPAATPSSPSPNREDVLRAALEAIDRIASFATMGDNAERSGELTGGRANGEPLPVRREVR